MSNSMMTAMTTISARINLCFRLQYLILIIRLLRRHKRRESIAINMVVREIVVAVVLIVRISREWWYNTQASSTTTHLCFKLTKMFKTGAKLKFQVLTLLRMRTKIDQVLYLSETPPFLSKIQSNLNFKQYLP